MHRRYLRLALILTFGGACAAAVPGRSTQCPQAAVPPQPPDTVPRWVYDPAHAVEGSWITGRYARDVLVVLFTPGTDARLRTEAVCAVDGEVIGGMTVEGAEGFYYIRIPPDPTQQRMRRAVSVLDALPQVILVTPEFLDNVLGVSEMSAAPASRIRVQEGERPLSGLGFMAGCWRGDAGVDRTIEEQWTAADSDVMLATTRYLDDNTGRTTGWEFSRIIADSAGITLFPAPFGTQQGRFRMVPSPAGEARFEDPAHDFPKRIIYRRVGERTLAVHLDAGEGSREAMELRLERVPCPYSASAP